MSILTKAWYKQCPPEETIHRIRTILHELGIFVTEESGYIDGFYHSHIYISNHHLRPFNIMTNGKGSTPAYALASAYSEMMERLQNCYKFYGTRYATRGFLSKISKDCEFAKHLENTDCVLDYASFEDEKYINIKDYLLSKDNIFYKEQTDCILKNGDDDFLTNFEINCVPYYDIIEEKYRLLPSECFYSGSNGMCAGNTPEEALVQGFCEIFERYALKQIMLYDLVPPQIPLDYFIGTKIYEKISVLENLKVIILDCSLQMNLPVIGVIVIDTGNNRCCLEMAGAATAEIALERCLTEHFQAGDPIEDMAYMFESVEFDDDMKFEQFYKQSKGFGRIDVKKLLLETPSYEFKGFHSVIGDNAAEELVWIINKIVIKNNLQCYIRDNSILGFPSYHIYIPSMSDIYDNHNVDDLYLTLYSMYLQPSILNLKEQKKDVLIKICTNNIKTFSKVRSTHISLYSNFLYNSNTRSSRPDNDLFLSSILLKCNEYEKSSFVLEKFVQRLNLTTDFQAIKYYNCALECIKNKGRLHDSEFINKLYNLFGEVLVTEVIEDLNSDNKLQYYELPSCFNCEICGLKKDCCFFDAMKLVKSIQRNTVLKNQESLKLLIRSVISEKAENPSKSRRLQNY